MQFHFLIKKRLHI